MGKSKTLPAAAVKPLPFLHCNRKGNNVKCNLSDTLNPNQDNYQRSAEIQYNSNKR